MPSIVHACIMTGEAQRPSTPDSQTGPTNNKQQTNNSLPQVQICLKTRRSASTGRCEGGGWVSEERERARRCRAMPRERNVGLVVQY